MSDPQLADLRRALLAERYSHVIRAAEALVPWVTPWTPVQQRRHRRDADAEVADYDARLRDAPQPYPPPSHDLRAAVVDDLPPRDEEVA